MEMRNICLDIADESAKYLKVFEKYVESYKVSRNITLTKTDLTDEKVAKMFFKNAGIYYTIHTKNLSDKNRIVDVFADTIKGLVGKTKYKSILVVGLGNRNVALDSLGANVVENIDVGNIKLHAVSVGVSKMTGIKSIDIVRGIGEQISSDLVIVIDTLATTKMERIYKSFQLTNTGLVPGSATGYGNDIIDRNSIGIDVLAVGVPTCIYARSLVLDGLRENARKSDEINDIKLSKILGKFDTNSLLSKKDVESGVVTCGKIIANSINKAFM